MEFLEPTEPTLEVNIVDSVPAFRLALDTAHGKKPLETQNYNGSKRLVIAQSHEDGEKMRKQIDKLIVNKRLIAERIRAWTEYQAAGLDDMDEVEKLDADCRNATIGRKLQKRF